MKHFKWVCNQHIDRVYWSTPYDALLYGKHENLISSSLASAGNIENGSKSLGWYYKTEYSVSKSKTVDICRVGANNIIEFVCESKFRYVSDMHYTHTLKQEDVDEINGGATFPAVNLQSLIGVRQSNLDIIVSKALRQLFDYTSTSRCRTTNRVLLLNLLFLPYGTNGNYDSCSGLKTVNRPRVRHDHGLYKFNNYDINTVVESVDLAIRKFPVLKSSFPRIRCIHKSASLLRSLYGFNYYVLTYMYYPSRNYT